MTDAEKFQALVSYRLEQADEALAAAGTNLDQGLVRSSSNRAYYAMFYAVLALLATRQEETSRHSGAIARFDQHYVKSGSLPHDFSRWLHAAFTQRQEADYGTEFTTKEPDVRAMLDHARTFIMGVRQHLRSIGFLPPTTTDH